MMSKIKFYKKKSLFFFILNIWQTSFVFFGGLECFDDLTNHNVGGTTGVVVRKHFSALQSKKLALILLYLRL